MEDIFINQVRDFVNDVNEGIDEESDYLYIIKTHHELVEEINDFIFDSSVRDYVKRRISSEYEQYLQIVDDNHKEEFNEFYENFITDITNPEVDHIVVIENYNHQFYQVFVIDISKAILYEVKAKYTTILQQYALLNQLNNDVKTTVNYYIEQINNTTSNEELEQLF